MATLVERLRRSPSDWQNPEQRLLDEAADTIESLQRDSARLDWLDDIDNINAVFNRVMDEPQPIRQAIDRLMGKD